VTAGFEPLPDDLAEALAAAASALGPFARVRYASEIESTNDSALDLAIAGEPEGAAVLAEAQRAGRGRRGRSWHSPPGSGLYLSVVVRPPQGGEMLSIVTLAAGVAVATAVRAITALPVELKWPNDIVIGWPWRKVGGLLSEAASSGSRLVGVVIGIGINRSPASYPRELIGRATDIESELGRPVDRAPLVVELLRQMRAIMGRLRAGDHDAICREWRVLGAAGLSGRPVRWREGEVERRGRAVDIASDGALLVEAGAGRVERVVAGEVIWESVTRE
jgi:BirA family biotin operon repressor/biotin-[acetyl-CoA-carboxylase] ligase